MFSGSSAMPGVAFSANGTHQPSSSPSESLTWSASASASARFTSGAWSRLLARMRNSSVPARLIGP